MLTSKNITTLAIVTVLSGAMVMPTFAPAFADQAVMAPVDEQSAKVVDAANTFIGTLSADQKAAALFAFDDAAQRVKWSNFPTGAAERNGVRWGDLTDVQRKALMDLLGAVLSAKGVAMVKAQMAGDDLVAAADATQAADPNAKGNGRPPVFFGSDYYFVSFVGTPSATAPWMLQFGGHHLAINATVVGPNITLSPSLTGGQPLHQTADGKAIYVVEEEAKAGAALLAGLTDDQRSKTIVSEALGDLVLGPGKDGMTLQPEGLMGREMTDAQKEQFLTLISARLDILNADDLGVAMADIAKNIDQTSFGWWGPTAPLGSAYFRVTGPTAIIEFSPQTNDGDPSDHAHNMYRDPTNEYGAGWAALN